MGMLPPPAKLFSQEVEKDASLRLCDKDRTPKRSAVFELVEKSLTGFFDSVLQSAARTPCAPLAHNSHTCSLRSVFAHVHAAVEN